MLSLPSFSLIFLENKSKMQYNPNNGPLPIDQDVNVPENCPAIWQICHHETAVSIPLLVSLCCI
jgi:hypothetical protein